MSNTKNNKGIFKPGFIEKLDADAMDQAMAPLKTIEDCYFTLDVSEKVPFAEVQWAYRYQLYKHNLSKVEPNSPPYVYRAQMLPKIKEAYRRICESLQQDPQQGLLETKESLIKERDELLMGWKGHSCGTPAVSISQEYDERIAMLTASSVP